MPEHSESITHPSYGVVCISRRSIGGAGRRLFASPMKHHQAIALTIKQAEMHRDLHENRVYSHQQLIEVEMSEAQFAQMITSANIGEGTPCTITRIGGQGIEEPPFDDERKVFSQEVTTDLEDLLTLVRNLGKAVDEIADKPRINKEDRARLHNMVRKAEQDVVANMPFIVTQFERRMDEVTTQAKIEFTAHVESTIRSAGLQAVQDNAPQLLAPMAAPET